MGARVLIADDEVALRRTLVALLHALGHTAIAVASGRDAIAALDLARFDLVLLDLRMPGLTGVQTWEQMQALPRGVPIPVLMTAAAEGPALAARHGMLFLPKPFELRTLCATIEAARAPRERVIVRGRIPGAHDLRRRINRST